MKEDRWEKPTPIDRVTRAFPAHVCGTLLPNKEDIPEEFWKGSTKWNALTSQWFFRGLDGEFVAKAGIDKDVALDHLGAVLASFEPKHEHKEAGVAYLMSRWFEDFIPAPKARS